MSLKTRTVAFFSILALSAVPLVALACPGAADAGDKDGASEYTIEATAAPVKVGAQGYAVITIKAAAGFHWNKEYPAKATVVNSGFSSVGVEKTEFKQTSGDFDAKETVATVKIPLTGKSAGKETLKVDTRFGVCSDKVCLIKKASADVTVVVAD